MVRQSNATHCPMLFFTLWKCVQINCVLSDALGCFIVTCPNNLILVKHYGLQEHLLRSLLSILRQVIYVMDRRQRCCTRLWLGLVLRFWHSSVYFSFLCGPISNSHSMVILCPTTCTSTTNDIQSASYSKPYNPWCIFFYWNLLDLWMHPFHQNCQ